MSYVWEAPSEEELANQPSEFDVLAEDEYIAVVKSIEVKKDQANKFPTKNDAAPTHDMIVVKMEAISFANGDALVDKDDEPVDEAVPFQVWLNPKKVGMIPQPSKTRKFFASAMGQALSDPIAIKSYEELVGTKLIVSLKPNGSYNNATDFRPIRRSRGRATTTRGPVQSEDLMERAKAIFDEDSPTNKSENRLANQVDDLDF